MSALPRRCRRGQLVDAIHRRVASPIHLPVIAWGAVGAGVGSAHTISQQISVPFRQVHAPQQQPQVVPEGQSFSSGMHSASAVGLGVGVGRRTQLQVVHPATERHTWS